MPGNAYLQIHLCVLLWGFTAILGKLITLSAIPLVFWRVSIVSLCLLFWMRVWRQLLRLTRRDVGLAFANGILVTLHWLCFYAAIKAANASVAATCMALAPAFLSIVEPMLLRQPLVARDLLVAVATIPGVVLVVGGIPSNMLDGLALGVLAAFLAAVFSIINKGLTMRVPALSLTAIEMSAGALLLGILIPLWPMLGADFGWPKSGDIFWLLILAIVCTLFPFVLSMVALRKISAFSAQLAVNLEPVYAIFLAAVLLGEGGDLGWPFYLGVVLILGAVVGHAAMHKRVSSAAG
jgi:drug/metabolite transporter (DMT)-like permease